APPLRKRTASECDRAIFAGELTEVPSQTFDLVLFGATGDLAGRKLLPALYMRFREREISPEARLFACARQQLSPDDFRAVARKHLEENVDPGQLDKETCDGFFKLLEYVPVDGSEPESFKALAARLAEKPADRTRVFFLATTPRLFAGICHNLDAAGAVTPAARVVLEKPLGSDLETSRAISDAVAKIFPEERIYRIDHHLGKEGVQNLLGLRFGNSMFEPLWSRAWVHDVQITIAEEVGAEGRGDFYDQTGALRDMVQSHLLQLLCITAMEPPNSIGSDSVRDAKLQVLRA